ncbi:MAG: UDP-glucose 4-epimerase GalE [Candidatus Omnitrophota bacterium]
MNKNILVIGGAGYIGSHMARLLLETGFNTVIFDNLSTGYKEFIPKKAAFIKGDLREEKNISKAFSKYSIDTVMHFAASSLVGESVRDPLKYYENNVYACVNLIKAMIEHKVKKFIFSSTAAVYGKPETVLIKEDNTIKPANPYGRSKRMIEKILEDIAQTGDLTYITLRYFNAAGAHPSAEIGEKHNPETHLIPNILKTAKGAKKELVIFGNDYPTKDGTCVRDYIHVQDLCLAHLLALKALNNKIKNEVFNLGSGNGYSIKEVIEIAQKITGKKIKTKTGPRRPGDPVKLVASAQKAKEILGWQAQYGLEEIIRTAWEWEKKRR